MTDTPDIPPALKDSKWVEPILGIPVRVDHRCPPDTAYFVHGGKVVGQITNLEPPPRP